jgi:hypothetical protein
MRNLLEKIRKSDYEEVKAGAQTIYLAEGRKQAEAAFRTFRARWRRDYGSMVRRLEPSTGVAFLLRLPPAPVAQAQDDQRGRALLRGGTTGGPAPWCAL